MWENRRLPEKKRKRNLPVIWRHGRPCGQMAGKKTARQAYLENRIYEKISDPAGFL